MAVALEVQKLDIILPVVELEPPISLPVSIPAMVEEPKNTIA